MNTVRYKLDIASVSPKCCSSALALGDSGFQKLPGMERNTHWVYRVVLLCATVIPHSGSKDEAVVQLALESGELDLDLFSYSDTIWDKPLHLH